MRIFILVCVFLLVAGSEAFAYGHLWYNQFAGIKNIKKIVVYPIDGMKHFETAEEKLMDYSEKKIEGVYFTLLKPPNEEAQKILRPNEDHAYMLQDFANEKARAWAVRERSGADAYLICRVRENVVQKDLSPEKAVNVEIKSWTEERGGPNGDRTYNESSYHTTHIIPAQYVYLHILDLEYSLYDLNGNKIMTFNNRLQGYGTSEQAQFQTLLKEFAKELSRAKKNSKT